MKKEKKIKRSEVKICMPTSSGGHLSHLILIKDFWEKYDRFWVTFNKTDANSALKNERVYHCYFPTNRNLKNLIKNTFLAIKILKEERPNIIISSGAAISIPFFVIGKLFFGCKCFYIEVFDRVHKGTISGKICYHFSDKFFVQREEQLKVYPKAEYIGSIF